MPDTITILGMAGSLRQGSFNAALLRAAAANGLLLVTPEYNNAMPGVFKNAIDWLSRPPQDIPRVFGGRPVALMGATPGGLGTVLAQTAWLPVVRALGMQPWFGTPLSVSGTHQVEAPDDVLLEFLQSTYAAGATLAQWDRAALERGI
jgi:chromate reductase